MQALTIVGLFIVSLFLNIPVGYSLGIASVGVIMIFNILPLGFVVQALFSSGDSFPLLAVPFFILAGDIMMKGGISKRIVDFARTMMGKSYGGLGVITVFTCMIFAAISGSGPATVAAIGGILIPAMIEEGYDRGFASSLGAAAGSLGPIIPPSIVFVVYGVIANVSITDLFIAGIGPGILMTIALVIYVKIVSNKNQYGIIRGKSTGAEKWNAFKKAFWSLLIPVIILGGIYGGIMTPTESAIIACNYGIIIGLFVYKEITLKDLPEIFAKSALTSGTVLVLIGFATAFGRILTLQHIPTMIAQGILGITSSKVLILLLINILLFFTGMLMETLAAIVILAPLLLSVVGPLGVDPVHFGMIMAVNLTIGMCTPPVGVNIFVASRLVPGMQLEEMFKSLVPLIGVLILVLMIVTYVPALSTFLPSLF